MFRSTFLAASTVFLVGSSAFAQVPRVDPTPTFKPVAADVVVAGDRKDGDSVWNGALAGVLVGVGTAGIVCWTRCNPGQSRGMFVLLGGVGAGIGAIVDGFLRREQAFSPKKKDPAPRLSVHPILHLDAAGVAVLVSF